MDWIYNDRAVTDDDLVGKVAFVYRITNLISGKQYIGKKKLTSYRRKKIKGKKNRKKIISSSDWREYYGSNDEILREIEHLGVQRFRRQILEFCSSLGEASYLELRYQVLENVLFQPDKYYNSIIQVRIHRKHVIKHSSNLSLDIH
jgi:hypothetical protein